MDVKALEDELFNDYITICASEDWSSLYAKDAKTHAKLIRIEATMERDIRRFFRTLAQSPNQFVNWTAYNNRLQDNKVVQAASQYNVDVIVTDDGVETMNDQFIKVMFDNVFNVTNIGAAAGQAIYKRNQGTDTLSAAIQRAAKERVAYLVGKQVDPDGHIIDNPKAAYRISDLLRNDIRESISTSLSLGEDQQEATTRLSPIITNPDRAALIAQTESVNGYQKGILTYGKNSGAVGKESQDDNADDECATYSDMGVVDIDYSYDGDDGPAYHPRCRCGLRLVYPEELDNDSDNDGDANSDDDNDGDGADNAE